MYVQLAFAIDRVKALAPLHPEWKDKEPFKAVLEGDMNALAASGEKGLVQFVMETHAGMTTGQFAEIVKNWLATARHPRFDRPYTELVYKPMLELLAYMRANGFKTFIVSGGGVEFMRPWTERIYGVPPEQVIGSSIKTKFQIKDGVPELFRLPEVDFIDDKAGKPVGINERIGRQIPRQGSRLLPRPQGQVCCVETSKGRINNTYVVNRRAADLFPVRYMFKKSSMRARRSRFAPSASRREQS